MNIVFIVLTLQPKDFVVHETEFEIIKETEKKYFIEDIRGGVERWIAKDRLGKVEQGGIFGTDYFAFKGWDFKNKSGELRDKLCNSVSAELERRKNQLVQMQTNFEKELYMGQLNVE